MERQQRYQGSLQAISSKMETVEAQLRQEGFEADHSPDDQLNSHDDQLNSHQVRRRVGHLSAQQHKADYSNGAHIMKCTAILQRRFHFS